MIRRKSQARLQTVGRSDRGKTAPRSVLVRALLAFAMAVSTLVVMPQVASASSGLTIEQAGPSWGSVSWPPHAGATGYQVYRNGSFVTYTTDPSVRLDGLATGVTYEVEVKAVLSDQRKITIGTLDLTPRAGGAVENSLSVSAVGPSWGSVSWPPHAGATGYQVYRNGSFVTYTTDPSVRLDGLATGVTYEVEVRAVLSDQKKITVGSVNLTPRDSRSAEREKSDDERENDMVDPDGDASGWEDNLNFARGTTLDQLETRDLFFSGYVKVQEDEAGAARKDVNDALEGIAKDFGTGLLGPVGSAIDVMNHFDDVDEHNRMVEELAKRGRAINDLEEERERNQQQIESLEGQLQDALDALDAERARQLEARIKKGKLQIAKDRKRMNVIYRKMYNLEQAELRYGEGALRAIPRVCVQNDTFNSSRCGTGYEAWWEHGRNILHLPRYCARLDTTYSCATGGRALHPETPRRPAFGEFKCKANGAVYWSNGSNAYSQIADSSPSRCGDVHASWAFTGKFRPRTGGKMDYRPLNHHDCPIQGETGQLNLSCKGKIVDVDPPGYPWGCIEHDRTGNWKCPGDTGYSRPKPVNTSIQDPKPKGDFTCQFNNLKYYSNGTAYMLKAARNSEVDQWLCRDVTLDFHVYCNHKHVRTVTPPNRKKQTCGPSGGTDWIPPVGNFICPANSMRYYSNGRSAYVHHTHAIPVPCRDVSPKMRFDGKSGG